jgi:hypothetical protein
MSSSATGPTSTTASSTNSASDPTATATARPGGCDDEPPITGSLPQPSPGKAGGKVPGSAAREAEAAGEAGGKVEVVACGALAGHIREIAARRGWPVVVRPLPAALHNRPEQIKGHAERELLTARAHGSRAVIAYADCGTYGALDNLATEAGVSRLPGLHCYDLYAGAAVIAQLFAEEPGTYLLTDYLIKSFEKAVIQPLGLDRHPDLWRDYFGHYTRLVWLAQAATTELEEAATQIAGQFKLPLTRVDTGTTGLETALARLIGP